MEDEKCCYDLNLFAVNKSTFNIYSFPLGDLLFYGMSFIFGKIFFVVRQDCITRIKLYEVLEDESKIFIGYFDIDPFDERNGIVYTKVNHKGSFVIIPIVNIIPVVGEDSVSNDRFSKLKYRLLYRFVER